MPPASTARLLPAAQSVAIRCYGQGLGDCFLLAFPRPDRPEEPFYLAIDCGVAKGTPDEEDRMRRVVADIHAATGGRLDVLALTHQHYDHVIGFVHAEELWNTIQVDQLYLPWTERPDDPEAATIGRAAARLSAAATRAVTRAALAAPGSRLALGLTGDLLGAGGESFGVSAADGIRRGWEIALNRCPEANRVFCEPGDVLPLADTGVMAHVLGPPRQRNRAGQEVTGRRRRPLIYLLEDPREMYAYEHFGLAADGASGGGAGERAALYASAEQSAPVALAEALLARDAADDAAFDQYCPFDASLRIGWEEALESPFFWEHYTAGPDWRRIDDDWLLGAADLALRAGNLTNNLSLVLAFELPQSRKVLLFVGDAQVGNWLSWRQIGHWWPRGAAVPAGPADIDDLLGRVAFYKVGHHGSHNATIRQQGLEKMTGHPIAYIPVSVPVAHDILSYCPMPFYPVLLALQAKTGGAVYLANGQQLEPHPAAVDLAARGVALRRSEEMLGPKIRRPGTAAEEVLEAAVPLWIEFQFQD